MEERQICEYCNKVIDTIPELVNINAKCGQGDWQVYMHFQCFLRFLKVLYKTKDKVLKALDS